MSTTLPTVTVTPVPTGGIVVISIDNETAAAPGPWTLTRQTGSDDTTLVTLYSGAPIRLFVDAGEQMQTYLDPTASYQYVLTVPAGTITPDPVQPLFSIVVQTDGLLTTLLRALESAIASLTLPAGWVRPTVLHAMPITGEPPIPCISLAQELIQQDFAPIGEGLDTDWTLNQYEVSDTTIRRIRIAGFTNTPEERVFYEIAVIGIFKALLVPLLSMLGQDLSHSFQSASSQVVSTGKGPGFFFFESAIQFTGLASVTVLTNWGTIEATASTVVQEYTAPGAFASTGPATGAVDNA